ncbi:RNA polymerase sigma factor SigZ [Marinifilum caeruleilacunae]|jgi:RNA polymerase sigma-70 factor (ECF subfamily)|uniref:RNA polymerase sigma factor n=1 Tax=Marinifilum caeruleilacunae TaxID=2499076 RepID=A0ABX1WX78_9BACT|nr:RNA polymerase sigma factor SigZ [Marinifilum caeruleilacunae]NOU60733.1 RNA polymerase sigma factor SigZ [Marinifilum caeruleilacunae]
MNCDIHHIYQRYSSHLLAFIRQQIKDSSTADDLLQEVFLRTMESCISEKNIKNLKSWLFQVTRNTIVDYYRAQNKTFQEQDYIIHNHFNSPDFQQILSEDIADMIELLPEEYAVPLRWSDIEGIPQKEIADKLNIGLPGAKSRIQRARKKLRDLFYECCDIELDAQGNIISCEIKSHCTPLLEKREQEKK